MWCCVVLCCGCGLISSVLWCVVCFVFVLFSCVCGDAMWCDVLCVRVAKCLCGVGVLRGWLWCVVV